MNAMKKEVMRNNERFAPNASEAALYEQLALERLRRLRWRERWRISLRLAEEALSCFRQAELVREIAPGKPAIRFERRFDAEWMR